MAMATTQKPKPPAPPRLPGKEEVGAHLPMPSQDDEEQEGSAADEIRSHLQDAHESITAAWERLDELEAEQE